MYQFCTKPAFVIQSELCGIYFSQVKVFNNNLQKHLKCSKLFFTHLLDSYLDFVLGTFSFLQVILRSLCISKLNF